MSPESGASRLPAIAVVGGTGRLGAALAGRLAAAGYKVVIGSRDAERAREAAASVSRARGARIEGASNAAAATSGEVVILAVPYVSRNDLLTEIRDSVAGKVVVDTTVPLQPPKVMRVQLPSRGSAAVEAQQLLGDSVKVVAAFHNVAAHKLATDEEIDCDVLVFGDDKSARGIVMELVRACRLRGLHGGVLANSAAAEALTSVLIFINRTYGIDGAGVRITGALHEIGA